jgi:hypothetical protein
MQEVCGGKMRARGTPPPGPVTIITLRGGGYPPAGFSPFSRARAWARWESWAFGTKTPRDPARSVAEAEGVGWAEGL